MSVYVLQLWLFSILERKCSFLVEMRAYGRLYCFRRLNIRHFEEDIRDKMRSFVTFSTWSVYDKRYICVCAYIEFNAKVIRMILCVSLFSIWCDLNINTVAFCKVLLVSRVRIKHAWQYSKSNIVHCSKNFTWFGQFYLRSYSIHPCFLSAFFITSYMKSRF